MSVLKGAQRFPKNSEIIKALQEAIHRYSIEAVALELGKNCQHFYEELNPNSDQRKAKIGLDDAIEASRIIDCTTWFEMMAGELGFQLVPKCPEPDKDSVAEEIADDLENLSDFSRVCRDNRSTEAEIRAASQALRKEIRETEELAVRERRERRGGLLARVEVQTKQ